MAVPKLSVLVATIPERTGPLHGLLTELYAQVLELPNQADVEILYLGDFRQWSVGQKRNALLGLATGEFLAFIDDDDQIDPAYLKEILVAIDTNPEADVVVFDQLCVMNGEKKVYCRYGIEYSYQHDGGPEWFGLPAHTMVWRRQIAAAHRFPDKNFGEDSDWVKRCVTGVRVQARIEKQLYIYRYSDKTTTTRGG